VVFQGPYRTSDSGTDVDFERVASATIRLQVDDEPDQPPRFTKSEALLNFPEGVGTTYLLTQRNEEFVIESQDPDDLLKGLFSFKFSLTYMFVFRNMLKQPI